MELRHPNSTWRGRRRTTVLGFTLIEILVSISVIALLIALAIPTIGRARGGARSTVCLSNLRGLGQVTEIYLARYSQHYPFATAGSPWDVSPDGSASQTIATGNHFDLALYWTTTFHNVSPWPESFGAWVCSGSQRIKGEPWKYLDSLFVGIPSYHLSSAFVADPKLWSGSATADPSYLRAVNASEVRFPSSKTYMWDQERAHQQGRNEDFDPTLQLFADGHAAVHRVSDAKAPVVNPFTGTARPLADTPNGVAGVDY